MAATTVYNSAVFNADNQPAKGGRPRPVVTGGNVVNDTVSIATTSLDDIGDEVVLDVVPHGATIYLIPLTWTDMDTDATETLDADIVLRETTGTTTTDTILYNAGTAFEDAGTAVVVVDHTVASPAELFAEVVFKVNAVAATPAAGTITYAVMYN